ncbi:MAG: CBS domain-containing protein [Planctomycetes bacterium]|nr:CBS domain-containing protein [Planctomycetota bacterium]
MSVGRICIRQVDTAQPSESVQAAGRRMLDRKVGTLVVVDEDNRPVGMITDRDLAVRVVARGLDAYMTAVSQIMTPSPRTVQESTPIESALAIMRSAACRRLPVVGESGTLLGLVSLDDVLDLLSEEFQQIRDLLAKESPEELSALPV